MDKFSFFVSTVFLLAGVVGIIFLAYWCSRYLGRRYGSLAQGKYMRILDRVVIGQDKYLILLETAGQIHLLGVTGQSIEKIGRLDPAELEELPNPIPGSDFAGTLSEMMKNKISLLLDRHPGEGGKH